MTMQLDQNQNSLFEHGEYNVFLQDILFTEITLAFTE